jgi:transposase
MLALNRKLELGIIGRGRERDLGNPNQLTLSMLEMMTGGGVQAPAKADDELVETSEVAAHQRQKPTGRKPLPETLPRVHVTVLPLEVQKAGLDAFEQIGEDVTETLERRPSALVVVCTHKPKFVEKDRDLKFETTVHQAPAPELPIERGLAGPGLLADTVVKRWDDHLPLHRQERISGREGYALSRSTICDWHAALADLARPLIGAMWEDAFAAPYLCVDATGVLVQALEKCRRAHFFVVASPERHVLFGFSPKHDNAAVDKLLAGYQGILVADAHAVYDHLFSDGKIREAGCWAHVRRYFFKSLGSDPPRARLAISLIGKLFHLERTIKGATPDQRLAARKRDAVPILDEFQAWCDAQAPLLVDESPISKAVHYAQNHRAALRTFLGDGRVPIDNNWSERELRREAVGRKNWLFVGSDDGGVVNATFVSLIASCKLHGLDPYQYLRDLFCLLPSWNAKRVLELSPLHWRETSARPEVQKALAENIYRRASLGG